MSVAIIDIGSNSIKLLVAEKSDTGLNIVAEDSEDTRISSKSSVEENVLDERRMLSAVESVKHLLAEAKHYNPEKILITATSAVRDAKNKDVFKHHIDAATSHPLRILSGEEEARGIAQGIKTDPMLQEVSDFCLFDLGGGSLELITYEKNVVKQAISLPLGAVRMTQKFIKDVAQPIPEKNIDAITEHVRKTINASGFSWPQNAQLVATGGAVNVSCNLIAHNTNQPVKKLSLQQVSSLKKELSNMPIEERLAQPALPTKRADIMPAALTVIETIMTEGQFTKLQQSYHNLRYGLAAQQLGV